MWTHMKAMVDVNPQKHITGASSPTPGKLLSGWDWLQIERWFCLIWKLFKLCSGNDRWLMEKVNLLNFISFCSFLSKLCILLYSHQTRCSFSLWSFYVQVALCICRFQNNHRFKILKKLSRISRKENSSLPLIGNYFYNIYVVFTAICIAFGASQVKWYRVW